MTQEEIIDTISRLPLRQKVEILETVLHNLGEALLENGASSEPATALVASPLEKLAAIERLRELVKTEALLIGSESEGEERQGLRLSQRLYGILKFDGEPPTDEEIKDSRADYLMEKYS